MSVIIDALERAKQEQAKRKDTPRTGANVRVDSFPGALEASNADRETGQGRDRRGESNLAPLLVLLSGMMILLLIAAAALITYLVLERSQPPTTPPATATIGTEPPGITNPAPAGSLVANPAASVPGGQLAVPTASVDLPVAHDPGHTPLAAMGVAPSETMQSSAGSPTGLPAPTLLLPRLGSIICDERGCTAMLDGRTARVGDWAGEFQVVQITEFEVRLQDAQGTVHQLGMRR